MSLLDNKIAVRIQLLGRRIHRSLSPFVETDRNVIQKGLILYRQNIIYKITVHPDKITATVQDVVKVKVKLDLSQFTHHTCTCPSETYCRHQLAVFFYMYSQFHQVTEWVEQWRKPLKEKEALQNLGIKRAKDLLFTKTKRADYDDWVQTYREIFHTVFKDDTELNFNYVQNQFDLYWRKVRANAPIQKEWKHLYELFAIVHSFILLKNFLKDQHTKHWFKRIFSEIVAETHHQMNRLYIQALPFAFDQFIDRMRGDVTAIFDEDDIFTPYSLELYFILWKKLFTKKNWREQELQRLEKLQENNDFMDFCLTVQYLLLKQDEQALTILKQMGSNGVNFLLTCFIYFAEEKDWKRIGFFLDYFIRHIQAFFAKNDHYTNIGFVQDAILIIENYIQATGKSEWYEKFFIETLPYSYSEYDEYLFLEKQYTKWADLQVLLGYDIETFSKEKIKILEKESPELLLPFYHHAVEENIKMKNRGNYRVAVRYLKKLRTLYKRQKRLDDWEHFLKILLEKTKRLRAFQEEVVRGKLVEGKRS